MSLRKRVRPSLRAASVRRGAFEVLEPRQLLAIDAGLLKDINTRPILGDSSTPHGFVDAGDFAYFFASDPAHGAELWRTNGTSDGTFLIKDILPGISGSGYPHSRSAAYMNGKLYFVADDGVHGPALWRSNGTAAGTILVADIPGMELYSSPPANLTVVENTLFFTAENETFGDELWKSDGTRAGTRPVADIVEGSHGSYPSQLTNVDGTLFFAANHPTSGRELWKSDGTRVGTRLVKDIRAGNDGFFGPSNFINHQGQLLFAADAGQGREPWTSDGTAAGTYLLKDINPGSGWSDPSSFTSVADTVFFAATSSLGRELWRTDGTEAGTTLVKDIRPAEASSHPYELTNVGGTVFFKANDGARGTELWRSDGTQDGTKLVKNIQPGAASSDLREFVNLHGSLFFTLHDDSRGVELWRSNGTDAGTDFVRRIALAEQIGERTWLFAHRGLLLFSGNDGINGSELWRSDGTAANTQLVRQLATRTDKAVSGNATNVGGILYFVANDGIHGSELWKTNGTRAGTVQVRDIFAGSQGSDPENLVNVGGTLFFTATDPSRGRELWKSKGTLATTVLVKNIGPGDRDSLPTWLLNVNGTLFFTASNSTTGPELWKSDGTARGTVLVRDIQPGDRGSNPSWLTNVNGTLFFAAAQGASGAELWKSEGSAASTIQVRDILPGSRSSDPQQLANADGTLFFSADDGLHGRELWKSNGSNADTVLVKDIMPPTPGYGDSVLVDSHPSNFVVVNDQVFFTADGGQGIELWKTNGTRTGTKLVKDIQTGTYFGQYPLSSAPSELVNFNGTLFFAANDGFVAEAYYPDRELWKSDGTAAGTVRVKDVNPGLDDFYYQQSSYPESLRVINGRLFFIATDEHFGRVPFTSDGTTAGTVRISDEVFGRDVRRDLNWVRAAGDNVFFSVSDGRYGREVFRYTNVAPQIAVDQSPKRFVEGDPQLFITDVAAVRDADNPQFNNARLTIEVASGRTTSDLLGLKSRGSISVVGSDIRRNGVSIGFYPSNRLGGAPLEIVFRKGVSDESIEAVIRSVTLRIQGNAPDTAPRRISFVLSDGDGGLSSPAYKTIEVVAIKDTAALSQPEESRDSGPMSNHSDAADGATFFTGGGTIGYHVNSARIAALKNAAIAPSCGQSFANASLRISITRGADVSNRLELGSVFSLRGNEVYRNENWIGTRNPSGGTGATDLRIVFAPHVTRDIVQQLARSIMFRTVDGRTSEARELTFTLSHGNDIEVVKAMIEILL